MLSEFKVEFAAIDWTQFHRQVGLRRIPAIFLLLAAGVYFHQLPASVLGTGTALSVGFGGARQVLNSRFLAMITTGLSMAICALAGTVIGNSYSETLLCVGIAGFVCGILALVHEDIGWIAMQGTIAFLIATNFANDWSHALERAGCVLAGGLIQTLVISLIWHLQGVGRFGPEMSASKIEKTSGHRDPNQFLAWMTYSSLTYRFGLRVAITLAMAVELDHLLKLKDGYWLPMTTLIVLKPDFLRTYTGGIQRVAGTLAGVVFASLLTAMLRPGSIVLIALITVLGWVTFSYQKVNAVIFSAALTSYVVFLIAITGLPESTVVWHRLINTALGCMLALASHFLGFFIVHPKNLIAIKNTGI